MQSTVLRGVNSIAALALSETGSTFKPKMENHPDQGQQHPTKAPSLPVTVPANQALGQSIEPKRILIVDDEETVALTLQEGLETLPNCEIITTTRAEQALQIFKQQPFDLLITDYKMPGMDGLMLAGYIRDLHPQIAIIVITAHHDSLLYERAAGISIECILDKPVKLSQIRAAALEAMATCAQSQTSIR